jgi:hypothetical protein
LEALSPKPISRKEVHEMSVTWRSAIYSSVLVLLLGLSCAYADEVGYKAHIKPIFDAKCLACHGSTSPEYPEFKSEMERYTRENKGPRMDSYTYLIFFVGWPDTGAIMRRLDDGKNTGDGKPGNMYQYLGNTEEERQENLAMFKRWVGNWTLKRWREISKEELEAIKVRY